MLYKLIYESYKAPMATEVVGMQKLGLKSRLFLVLYYYNSM